MAGALPDLRVRRIEHARDVGDALRRMLAGSTLHAVRVDATTWRIEPLAPTRRLRKLIPRPPPELAAGDIIVTASKRDERLSDLPASISIVGGQGLGRLAGRRGLVDVMATTDGAFSTNLGPGRDRIFLRGVADSAFNGTSQSLVSLYLDDARIGYAAPDPDLRLVDVDRVEVLRGPQGTLYGTGALGGVVRIATVAPDLDRFAGSVAVEGTGITNGALGGAVEGIVNLPIRPGTLALRVSGWSETMPGWIDDSGRDRRDVNRTRRNGARAALRWALGDWHATLAGVAQRIDARDSQYATRGLSRATLIAEPQDSDFTAATLTLQGPIGKLDARATTAVVDQEFGSTYDATVLAPALGAQAPLSYVEDRSAQLLSQELRVSDPTARHPWIVGVTILHSTSRLDGRFLAVGTAAPAAAITARRDEENVTDAALFAEGTQRLSERLDFKLGLRAFSTTSHLEQQAPERERVHRLGVTPSGTLSWHRDDLGLVWLRYASAVRPAGISRTAPVAGRRIPGDELQSLELGWRIRLGGDRLSIHGALYGSTWEHLRSDTVGADGLLGTIDAGNATNVGLEVGGRWELAPVAIDFGATVQRARLTTPSGRATIDDDDRRLPVVPDLSARLAAARRFVVHGLPAQIYAQARYVGSSRLSFDPVLDRPAGNYATLDTGASLDAGARHWSINVANLLDSRGNSFGFGNPFTLDTTTQTVPVRPRTITLRLAIGL